VLFLQFGWGNQVNAIVYGGLAREKVTLISDASAAQGKSSNDTRPESSGGAGNDGLHSNLHGGLDSGLDSGLHGGLHGGLGRNGTDAADVVALKQRLALLTRQLADEVARLPAERPPAATPESSTPELSTPDALRGQLRREIKARRLRERILPDGLFADPAWDILLDLTLARLEGRQTPVSSLCIAAAVPTTTALRWIKTLLDRGLIERRPDPDDRRRHYIHVSDATFAMMMQLMGRRSEPESRAG